MTKMNVFFFWFVLQNVLLVFGAVSKNLCQAVCGCVYVCVLYPFDLAAFRRVCIFAYLAKMCIYPGIHSTHFAAPWRTPSEPDTRPLRICMHSFNALSATCSSTLRCAYNTNLLGKSTSLTIGNNWALLWPPYTDVFLARGHQTAR